MSRAERRLGEDDPHIRSGATGASFFATRKAGFLPSQNVRSHAMDQVVQYLAAHRDEVVAAIRTHAMLSGSALAICIAACVPLGVWCSRHPAGPAIVAAATAARVVPSLAVLVIMLPLLGLGFAPALVALALLGCPPVLVNVFVGFRDVDPAALEAARGMGMSARQVLRRVEAPLAFPVVLAGIRTAAVEIIASATLATFIGGGGLGDLINNGLQLDDRAMLATGAACVALMALFADWLVAGAGALAGRGRMVRAS